jgi:hypothetical protein
MGLSKKNGFCSIFFPADFFFFFFFARACCSGVLSSVYSWAANEICRDFVRVSYSDWSFTNVFLFKDVGSCTEWLLLYVDRHFHSWFPASLYEISLALQTLNLIWESRAHTSLSAILDTVFHDCGVSTTGGKTWKLQLCDFKVDHVSYLNILSFHCCASRYVSIVSLKGSTFHVFTMYILTR